jgi:quercetin 2,3-dioxygenase
MSNLDRTPPLMRCGGTVATSAEPTQEIFPGREVLLGESTKVRRLLPNLGRRLVGAWCFVDHYGPDDITATGGMQVPPHPHMGLQTVSWLLDGEVHHRDSIGSDVVIRPGELGLMTSGEAITHAEYSPVPHPALLHGVQLWVALPGAALTTAAAWRHHHDLPVVTDSGVTVTVIMGSLAGAESPGRAFTPLVGGDVAMRSGATTLLPVEPDFEHAVLVMSGAAEVDGVALEPGTMLYLGCARRDLRLSALGECRLLLLGGEPFAEEIVMWWNFVGRSHADIAAARDAWERGERFGTVPAAGEPLAAPPLPAARLRPGGATRRRT